MIGMEDKDSNVGSASLVQTYQVMLRSLPFGYARIDRDGAILEFNPAAEAITGYPAGEVLGRLHQEILHGTPDAKVCSLSFHRGSTAAETTIRCKNGRNRTLSLTSSPLLDADNNFMGGLEFFRDVTEDKRRERERNNFLAMIAHDMKTPLVLMGGFLTRLASGKAGPVTEEQKEDLSLLIDEAARLEGLIDGIMEFAKVRFKAYQPVRSPYNLLDAVDRQIRLAEAGARERGIRILRDCPLLLPEVHVDGAMIDRVLANLLDNAIKYTHPQGWVRVKVTDEGECLKVEISDNGLGISESELPYIFDVFHRALGEIKGTGLGLAIVKKILDAHRECISVKSEPGQGTSFSFSIRKSIPGIPENNQSADCE
jgi:PAS domain S-box-containing protein